MSSTACECEKSAGERPVSYLSNLSRKVVSFFIEPVESNCGQLPKRTTVTGTVKIGLVPLGPEIDCTKVRRGLARALNKGSSATAGGLAGDNQSTHVKICGNRERAAPSEDLDVVVLIAGKLSTPRISVLSHRSLLDRGISSLLVYRGDIESYDSEGWVDVADLFIPEGRFAERLGEMVSLPWSRYSVSIKRLALLCLEPSTAN